jgi:hypothetical protein
MADEATRAKEIQDAIEMADKAKADAAARKDAEGETLDKLLAMLTTVNDRLDSMEAKDKERADAEAAAREPSDPEPLAADSTEEPKMETKMDSTGVFRDTFGDAVYRLDSVKSREQWQNDASLAQSQINPIYSMGGSSAPQICEGESIRNYRIRLLQPLQHTSVAYAKLDSSEFKKLPASVFAIAEQTIRNDADKCARNPVAGAPDGSLREFTVEDRAGRRVTQFAGTRSFIHDFSGERRRLVGIRTRND